MESHDSLATVIGFIGVGLLLLAFVLNLAKILKAESVPYLALNLIGAGLACAVVVDDRLHAVRDPRGHLGRRNARCARAHSVGSGYAADLSRAAVSASGRRSRTANQKTNSEKAQTTSRSTYLGRTPSPPP